MNPIQLTAVPTAKGADALAELSALRLDLSLIHNPQVRMKASLRLLAAWNACGLPTRHLRAELLETMKHAIPQHLARSLFLSRIEAILEEPAGPEMAIHLFEFGQQTPSYGLVRMLTQRGFLDLAREYTTLLGGVHYEKSASLSGTGVEGWGRHKRFIGRVDDVEHYPNSRALVVGCLQQLSERSSPHPALVAAVEARVWALEGADRQDALAMRPLVAWQVGGETAAWAAWRAIRYKSRRLQALERLVAKARSVGNLEAANRFLQKLPPHRHSRCALPPGRGPAALIWTATIIETLAQTLRDSLENGAILDGPERTQLLQACQDEVSCAKLAAFLTLDDRPGVLLRLKSLLGQFGADALWAGWMKGRQEALLETSVEAPMALTLMAHGEAEREVQSLARARYDEALALQADGHARRRVLARAVKATLALALREPESVSATTLRVRVRTLSHLGDAIAANVLRPFLAKVPSRWPSDVRQLIVAMSTGSAAAPPDFPTLSVAILTPTVGRLSHQNRLPANTHRAWKSLVRAVRSRLNDSDATHWLWEVLSTHQPFPSPETLHEVLSEVQHRTTLTPYSQILEEALAELDGLAELPLMVLLAQLTERPMLLNRLRWHQPPLLADGVVTWDSKIWSDLLKYAPEVGVVAPEHIPTFTSTLQNGSPIAERLLAGRCPTTETVWSISEGTRLRFLDKRNDLFTFLRFPDSAACCWRSSRGYSNPVRERLLSLWMDPLSFCFLVEGTVKERWSPVGFVFGSFGVSQGKPIMLLNGLYLRRRSCSLRTDTLAQLEAFGESLGLRWLVIANRHGGSGTLPTTYQSRYRPFQRLRALKQRGRLVSRTSDDIGNQLNSVVYAPHLYWRALRNPAREALD